MDAKHTPGPWTLNEGARPWTVECATRGFEDVPEANGRVCEVGYLPNARLIATAPELLGAAKPFAEIAGEGDEDFPDETKVTLSFGRTTNYSLTLGDLRRIQRAADKAEGYV